jgi:hypothetical protein
LEHGPSKAFSGEVVISGRRQKMPQFKLERSPSAEPFPLGGVRSCGSALASFQRPAGLARQKRCSIAAIDFCRNHELQIHRTTRAFSSEVETGSREENATKQEARLFSRPKGKRKQSRR